MLYYLVPINEYMFVNPNNVATLLYEGPETTRITYVDGRAQDRVEMPIQQLADILNGETMRFIITQDKNDWYCNVPGENMHIGFGSSAEEAFQDAVRVKKAREEVPADSELPFEETDIPAADAPSTEVSEEKKHA